MSIVIERGSDNCTVVTTLHVIQVISTSMAVAEHTIVTKWVRFRANNCGLKQKYFWEWNEAQEPLNTMIVILVLYMFKNISLE